MYPEEWVGMINTLEVKYDRNRTADQTPKNKHTPRKKADNGEYSEINIILVRVPLQNKNSSTVR